MFPHREEAKDLLYLYYLSSLALSTVPIPVDRYLEKLENKTWSQVQTEAFFTPNVGLRWCAEGNVMIWHQAAPELLAEVTQAMEEQQWWADKMDTEMKPNIIQLLIQSYSQPGYNANMRSTKLMDLCKSAEEGKEVLIWLQARAMQNVYLYNQNDSPRPDEGVAHR